MPRVRHLQPLCIEQTANHASCQLPAMIGYERCYFHHLRVLAGLPAAGTRGLPPMRKCQHSVLYDGSPCQGWVAYRVPDADQHEWCNVHYLQHLRELDRTASQGCGCWERVTRRGPGRPRKVQP